jgi:hypothetical protein
MRGRLAVPFAALMLATGTHAQTSAPTTRGPVEMKPSGTPGKAEARRTMKVTATVYAIDAGRRIVTLQNEMGGIETFKVGPDVKSLEGIVPGDTIVIEYQQGLALEFQPAGSEIVSPTAVESGLPAGEAKGSVAAADMGVKATVTITAINLAKRVVTILGPGGNVYKVKAGPTIQLEKLKVGDKLLATYVEAVAVKLEKAKK